MFVNKLRNSIRKIAQPLLKNHATYPSIHDQIETFGDFQILCMFKVKKCYQMYFSEIHRNREFYRTNDVRPPFTYASLIRQVSSLWSPIFWLLQKSIIYYVLPRGGLYSLSFFRKQQVKNLIFNEKFPLMFLGRDWISRASADFARDLQLVHLHFCILQKECGKLEGT